MCANNNYNNYNTNKTSTLTFGSSLHKTDHHRTVQSVGVSIRSLLPGDAFGVMHCDGHTLVFEVGNGLGHPILVEQGVGMVSLEASLACG